MTAKARPRACVYKIPVPSPHEVQSNDLAGIPDNWSHIRQKEAAVAVENPKAPRRHDQKSHAQRHDLHQIDHDLKLLVAKAESQDRGDRPGRKHEDTDADAGNGQKQGANGTRDTARLTVVFVV